MTKEQKAEEYATKGYSGLAYFAIKKAFEKGHESAEQSSDETMIAFARWIIRCELKMVHKNSYMDTNGMIFTLSELLNRFKEAQNKEA